MVWNIVLLAGSVR